MATQRVFVPYPARGISENYGYSYQEELTCRDSRNMRVRDPRTGRLRGAQRAGVALYNDSDAQVTAGKKILDVGQIVEQNNNISYSEQADPTERWTNAGNREGANCILTYQDDFGLLYAAYDDHVIEVLSPNGGVLHAIDAAAQLEAFAPNLTTPLIQGLTVDQYRTIFIGFAWEAGDDADDDDIPELEDGLVFYYAIDAAGDYTIAGRVLTPGWPIKYADGSEGNRVSMCCVGLATYQDGENETLFTLSIERPKASTGTIDEHEYVKPQIHRFRNYIGFVAGGANLESETQSSSGYMPVGTPTYHMPDYQTITAVTLPIATADEALLTTSLSGHKWFLRNKRWVGSLAIARGSLGETQLGQAIQPRLFFTVASIDDRNRMECCVQGHIDANGYTIFFPSMQYRNRYGVTEGSLSIGAANATKFAWSNATGVKGWSPNAANQQLSDTINIYGVGGEGLAVTDHGVSPYLIPSATSAGDPFAWAMGLEAFSLRVDEWEAGDTLEVFGPNYNGDTATATITMVAGAGTDSIAYDTGTRSATYTIYKNNWDASASAGPTKKGERAYLGYAWGSLFTNNYEDSKICVPQCFIGLGQSTDDKFTITHPKPGYTLTTSEAYVKATKAGGGSAHIVGLTDATATAFPDPSDGWAHIRRQENGETTTSTLGTRSWQENLGGEWLDGSPITQRLVNPATFKSTRTGLPSTTPPVFYAFFPWGRTSTDTDYNDKTVLAWKSVITVAASKKVIDVDNPTVPLTVQPDRLAPPSDQLNDLPEKFSVGGARDAGADGQPSLYNYALFAASQVSLTGRTTHTYAITQSGVYKVTASGPGLASGGASIAGDTQFVQSAVWRQRAYISDGTSYWEYDPTTGSNGEVLPLDINAGIGPPLRGKLLEVWRDRLVISRIDDQVGTWAMSKAGDPSNWDYFPSSSGILPGQAVQSDLPLFSGRVPDIVNAVIPWTNDVLIFGGDRSIWQLTGDPTYGGQVDLISDATGIAFGRAFCKDPEGGLWFFGSQGGLYYMQLGALPIRVSINKVERQLKSINLQTYRIALAYDPIEEGVHVYQMPYGAGGEVVDHWFYEVQAQAWHKDRFGVDFTNIQPTAVCLLDGDEAQDRRLLLGCEDSRLRVTVDAASVPRVSDQITSSTVAAIDSFVLMGPLVDNPVHAAQQVTELSGVLSASAGGCTFELFSTDQPEDLGSAVVRGKLQPGRNDRRLVRVSGDHVYMRLRNGKDDQTWAYEGMSVLTSYGGEVRR